MNRLRRGLRPVLHAADAVYRRRHRLQPVGPLLHVGCARYTGQPRRFDDGTALRAGDALGTLHFDNTRIAELDASTRAATGLGFARLFFESLHCLAELALENRRFQEVKAFRGVGYNRHGRQIGFVIEPVPDGWRARLLAAHIRLLIWAFTPADDTAATARPAPTVSWITRATLLSRFAKSPAHERA